MIPFRDHFLFDHQNYNLKSSHMSYPEETAWEAAFSLDQERVVGRHQAPGPVAAHRVHLGALTREAPAGAQRHFSICVWVLGADRTSSILGIWAAPAAGKPLEKGGPLRGPPAG